MNELFSKRFVFFLAGVCVTQQALKAVSKKSVSGDWKAAHAKYELRTEQFPKRDAVPLKNV